MMSTLGRRGSEKISALLFPFQSTGRSSVLVLISGTLYRLQSTARASWKLDRPSSTDRLPRRGSPVSACLDPRAAHTPSPNPDPGHATRPLVCIRCRDLQLSRYGPEP
jgi:hypothetical protein